MGPAILPPLHHQRRASPPPCAGVQPGQFYANAGDAHGGGAWSLTLREKLIKIGAKVVSHGRYVTFQMAEVAVPRQMFQEILSLNRPAPGTASASVRGAWSDLRQATAGEGAP